MILVPNQSVDLDRKNTMAAVTAVRTRALQSRDAIELLSNKWRVTILHLLNGGTLRAGQIQRAMDNVSTKVLTQTLRGLERDGLVQRRVHNVIPPHVEYQLTAMGKSVIPHLRRLCHWAREHAAHRDEARERFDQKLKQATRSRQTDNGDRESDPAQRRT
jgi:DNA-binding HxlR family transcriptional regulator